MSRTHDGHHATSPFGNPLWLVFSKGSNRSPKLLALLNSFEQSLAESFRKLISNDSSKFLSLLWLRQAVDSLLVSHNKFKALITDLEFPASVWDEKWIKLYLDDSVKLLDVCIALISEVSRLEQHQILLRYALQILNMCDSPSLEQLQRAGGALHEWMQKLLLRSSRLENTPDILLGMIGGLSLPKVKNSPKGRVLMRALYAIKVEMIFVSNVLVAVFSGCSKPLMGMQVYKGFLWAEAFNDLQPIVNEGLRSLMLLNKPIILKELGEVDACSRNLHSMMMAAISQKDEKEKERDSDVVEEVRKRCAEPISKLNTGAKYLDHELELLGKTLNNFFEHIISGRDGLLSSLRTFEDGRKPKS